MQALLFATRLPSPTGAQTLWNAASSARLHLTRGWRPSSAMASAGPPQRPPGKLQAVRGAGPGTALLICDIQERFRDTIVGYPAVIDTARRLVLGAQALSLPIIVTEQYPKALGATVAELKQLLPADFTYVDKTRFSMCVDAVQDQLKALPSVTQVLLVGIEAHVCVLQTSLDLLEAGYEVHLMADGISSSRLTDRQVALQRLMWAGAFLSTSEMALFQLAGDAKHPAFKTISALAKEKRPQPITPPSAL